MVPVNARPEALRNSRLSKCAASQTQDKETDIEIHENTGRVELLFGAQCLHRFDVRAMPGGHAAGDEGGGEDEQWSSYEGPWVVTTNAVEKACEQARDNKRGRQTEKQAGKNHAKCAPYHHAQDARTRGSECDADANFRDALADRKCDDSIEADQCEEQCCYTEECEQCGLKTATGRGRGDGLLHGADIGERDGGVDRSHGGMQGSDERIRWHGGS